MQDSITFPFFLSYLQYVGQVMVNINRLIEKMTVNRIYCAQITIQGELFDLAFILCLLSIDHSHLYFISAHKAYKCMDTL